MSAREPVTYSRNQRGNVIHLDGCRSLTPGQGVPWTYALDFTAERIRTVLASTPWLRACKLCRPDVDVDQ